MLGPEITEIDYEHFERHAPFYVYLHKRPDGTVFYVGKGVRSRAFDFAPSRRTIWHKNIVAKHGRENIGVQLIPCYCEEAALMLERAHIAMWRAQGIELANLTDGGEGSSGYYPNTEAQRAALARGRRKGKKGTPGPRPQFASWTNSEGHKAAIKKAIAASVASRAANPGEPRVCAECEQTFMAKSPRANCCGRLCEQRYRRAGKNK